MESHDPIHHTAAPDAERGASAADDVHLDEGAYVKLQAEEAKAAMAATIHEMGEKLKNMGNVRAWTRDYPWIAAGLAVGAGFAAAVTLVPTDKREAAEKWEKLKSTFTPKHDGKGNGDGEGRLHEAPPGTVFMREAPKADGRGWMALAIAELIKIVRPLLLGFLTSNFGGRGEEVDGADDAADTGHK